MKQTLVFFWHKKVCYTQNSLLTMWWISHRLIIQYKLRRWLCVCVCVCMCCVRACVCVCVCVCMSVCVHVWFEALKVKQTLISKIIVQACVYSLQQPILPFKELHDWCLHAILNFKPLTRNHRTSLNEH